MQQCRANHLDAFVLAFLLCSLSATVAGQTSAAAPLTCGKYAPGQVQSGPRCYRYGLLPWYAALQSMWETELRINVNFSGELEYSLDESTDSRNLIWMDAKWGFRSLTGFTGQQLGPRSSYVTRITGEEYCIARQCTGGGAISISLWAPDEASMDRVSAGYTYKFLAGNDRAVSQAILPVIFEDQATSRWSASVTETPRSRQAESGGNFTAFVVKNFSADQNVQVSLYDLGGNILAKHTISATDAGFNERGFMLSDFFGIEVPAGPGADFRGTLVFEGELGGKIAPVVLQMTGTNLTAVLVNAE